MTIAAMHAHLLRFPKHVWILLALYGAASSAHFAHNAAYIAFYPGIPAWLTAEKVHAGWIAVSSIGVLGVAFAAIGWRAAALLSLAVYGASGLDGLRPLPARPVLAAHARHESHHLGRGSLRRRTRGLRRPICTRRRRRLTPCRSPSSRSSLGTAMPGRCSPEATRTSTPPRRAQPNTARPGIAC